MPPFQRIAHLTKNTHEENIQEPITQNNHKAYKPEPVTQNYPAFKPKRIRRILKSKPLPASDDIYEFKRTISIICYTTKQ